MFGWPVGGEFRIALAESLEAAIGQNVWKGDEDSHDNKDDEEHAYEKHPLRHGRAYKGRRIDWVGKEAK